MRQRHARLKEFATLIGAAMELGLVHRQQQIAIKLAVTDSVEKSGNTTQYSTNYSENRTENSGNNSKASSE